MIIWKEIPGYENRYRISSKGEILSIKRNTILKPYQSGNYARASLSKDGKVMAFSVHRLVLLAFIGDSPLQVNHKDGNKKNNSLSNLEYVTASQNSLHAYGIGLQISQKGENHGRHKLTEKEVLEIKELNKKGEQNRTLAKKYNISIRTIRRIVSNTTWKHIL
jgi:hypothetical protein